jgi:hypothetical protein
VPAELGARFQGLLGIVLFVVRGEAAAQVDETRVEYAAGDILKAFRVFREYNEVGDWRGTRRKVHRSGLHTGLWRVS